MRDRDLYAQILGIRAPWKVTEVDLDTAGETVEVHVRREAGKVCCTGPAPLGHRPQKPVPCCFHGIGGPEHSSAHRG